jgi:two-component system sensor histidine kinase VicK
MKHTLSSERMLFDVMNESTQRCDLVSCARRAQDDVGPTAGALLNFQPTNSIWVMGNAELIRLAIANLLSNAKRYSPADSEIKVWFEVDEQSVSLHVQDAGQGLAEVDISRIFDKYFRGQQSSGLPGAGLGLYLVQLIMRRHHGAVEAKNNPQGGAIFTLKFPRVAFDGSALNLKS